MNSHRTARFREAFATLPADVQRQARNAYKLFVSDPHHPSLHFKQIHPVRPVYSVRIGREHRAVGIRDQQDIVWFWIGGHEEYDKLIKRLLGIGMALRQ